MEQKYRVLILTDHTEHTPNNSLYDLARIMSQHPLCAGIDVASRGIWSNRRFFFHHTETTLDAVKVTSDFKFEPDGLQFAKGRRIVNLSDFDVVFIRLPHPVHSSFFDFLTFHFDEKKIINQPSGILEVGSKSFLIEVRHLCPPLKLCTNYKHLEEFYLSYQTVLKPLMSYGGKGLIKVDGKYRFLGDKELTPAEYLSLVGEGLNNGGWLAMKYLKNVTEGDKRIVVVNGKIIGASLRKPPKDSWLCNVAQGGISTTTSPTIEELEMIKYLNPILKEKGVVMYGIDTLLNDNGKRVLSEINALSIGGLTPMEKMYKQPIIKNTSDELWNYIGRYIPTGRLLKH